LRGGFRTIRQVHVVSRHIDADNGSEICQTPGKFIRAGFLTSVITALSKKNCHQTKKKAQRS
jgi:hypothetical protein